MAKNEVIPFESGKVAFEYNGVEFVFNDRLLLNLTAMWKAEGSPANMDPSNWRRKEGKGFIADLARSLNMSVGHIIVGERGKGGSTHAHWQIAIAYAKYLSHDFHRKVNEAFRQYVAEEQNPALKMERAVAAYLKKGKTADWITRRFKGIVARNQLTATMADHLCKARGRDDNPFAEITRIMSLVIFGKTPREIKEGKGLPASAKTRDHIDEDDLISMEWAEIKARKLIQAEAAIGNESCVKAGERAAIAIKAAIDSLSK